MIASFRSKVLKQLWVKDDASGIKPEWRAKVSIVLGALNVSIAPSSLDLPGFGFHPLIGNRAGEYALTVSRNWRITFGWSGQHAVNVDLEDYHGR